MLKIIVGLNILKTQKKARYKMKTMPPIEVPDPWSLFEKNYAKAFEYLSFFLRFACAVLHISIIWVESKSNILKIVV